MSEVKIVSFLQNLLGRFVRYVGIYMFLTQHASSTFFFLL